MVCLICVFTPSVEILRFISGYTVHIMIWILVLGISFLMFGNKNLMYSHFIGCMVLCVFLKNASNSDFSFAKPKEEEVFSVVHIDLSTLNPTEYDSIFSKLLISDPDIISFQELTLFWEPILRQTFGNNYSFNNIQSRIDPYAMALFSKLPMGNHKALMYDKIPSINSSFYFQQTNKISIISTYIADYGIENGTKDHLMAIADSLKSIDGPVIHLGNFNSVYWTSDIRNYRTKSSMKNSRRDISTSMWEVPVDHIFYSKELECTGFSELFDSQQNWIGIQGQYQLINPNKPVVINEESKVSN